MLLWFKSSSSGLHDKLLILVKFAPLAAPEVDNLQSAASDENFIKMMTFQFRWRGQQYVKVSQGLFTCCFTPPVPPICEVLGHEPAFQVIPSMQTISASLCCPWPHFMFSTIQTIPRCLFFPISLIPCWYCKWKNCCFFTAISLFGILGGVARKMSMHTFGSSEV